MLGDKKLLKIIETLLMNSFSNLEKKGHVKVRLSYNTYKDMLIFCIEDSSKAVK